MISIVDWISRQSNLFRLLVLASAVILFYWVLVASENKGQTSMPLQPGRIGTTEDEIAVVVAELAKKKLISPAITPTPTPTPTGIPHRPVTHCLCGDISPPDDCGFALNRSFLVYQPQRHAERESIPCLLMDSWLRPFDNPTHSLILVVHNHADVVETVLERIIKHARELFELVLVLDGCTDQSQQKSMALLQRVVNSCARVDNNEEIVPSCDNNELVHVRVILQSSGIFESSANNLGLRSSFGKFMTVIQDDQIMETDGFNAILAAPLRLYDDVFAVTGRCAHTKYSKDLPEESNLIGRCAASIDRPLDMSPEDRCSFFIRDTANRGPLTFRADRMQQLGYFDELHFVLGDDDHDLMTRAYYQKRWVVGLMPLDFAAPLHLGATRKSRPQAASDYLQWRMGRDGDSFMRKILSDQTKKVPLHDETRRLPLTCTEPQWWAKVPHDLDQKINAQYAHSY